ncbi:MAG: SDR family NAD(P)-dependent oxidoreductase, partial [Cyclobacteriaceae bacterium]|nr:SDR family NAD(P)-dependent oxidoreductase [Cyclobacteriaceae bacterium HetDA_MAG_MS6]
MKNQKTVLITGANKGIGLEVAKQLGNLGFFVVLTARDAGRGQEAWKQLERQGTKGMFLQMDVGSVSSIQQAAQELLGQVNHIDILINNAGILLDEQHHLMDTPPDIALQTLQVNALGALWVTQTFAPLLHKGSRVIMISSGA